MLLRFSSQQLKLGENINTIPTVGFNVEEIVFENLTMTVWDVGGQEKIRALWRHYYGEWRSEEQKFPSSTYFGTKISAPVPRLPFI